jgi:hypothetical protein
LQVHCIGLRPRYHAGPWHLGEPNLGFGESADQITLEFGEGHEDAEDHAAAVVVVSICAHWPVNTFNPMGRLKALYGVDQMSQGAAQAVALRLAPRRACLPSGPSSDRRDADP